VTNLFGNLKCSVQDYNTVPSSSAKYFFGSKQEKYDARALGLVVNARNFLFKQFRHDRSPASVVVEAHRGFSSVEVRFSLVYIS
jgi:hypothetical protein